jgi:type IV secretion system protein VirB10
LGLTAAWAQTPKAETQAAPTSTRVSVPAGTKVPVMLKHAISTKSAKPGDPVYAETSFPVVVNERVLIPAGTYVQGRISKVERAGRVKGRAEVLIHFSTLIYPSGYTVILPGAIEGVPGAERTNMKDEEGTIQQQGEKGKDVGTVAGTTATGALIGAAVKGGRGAGIGAGAGAAAGLIGVLLSRGGDVRLEAGTTLDMVIQRDLQLDRSRILVAK